MVVSSQGFLEGGFTSRCIVITMNYTLLSEVIIIIRLECLIMCSDDGFEILSTVRPSLVLMKHTGLETKTPTPARESNVN